MSGYPDGWPSGYDIAGWGSPSEGPSWGSGGSWFNVEQGDRLPEEVELADAAYIVLHWEDERGIEHYATISSGFDDWDHFIDYVETDIEDRYGAAG